MQPESSPAVCIWRSTQLRGHNFGGKQTEPESVQIYFSSGIGHQCRTHCLESGQNSLCSAQPGRTQRDTQPECTSTAYYSSSSSVISEHESCWPDATIHTCTTDMCTQHYRYLQGSSMQHLLQHAYHGYYLDACAAQTSFKKACTATQRQTVQQPTDGTAACRSHITTPSKCQVLCALVPLTPLPRLFQQRLLTFMHNANAQQHCLNTHLRTRAFLDPKPQTMHSR
jgi:hypothetical protein